MRVRKIRGGLYNLQGRELMGGDMEDTPDVDVDVDVDLDLDLHGRMKNASAVHL